LYETFRNRKQCKSGVSQKSQVFLARKGSRIICKDLQAGENCTVCFVILLHFVVIVEHLQAHMLTLNVDIMYDTDA